MHTCLVIDPIRGRLIACTAADAPAAARGFADPWRDPEQSVEQETHD
jgi:hypothetical protein